MIIIGLLALVIVAVIIGSRKSKPVYDPIIGKALMATMDRCGEQGKAIDALTLRLNEMRTVIIAERLARKKAERALEAESLSVEIVNPSAETEEKPN